MDFCFFKENIMGGKKHSLKVIGSGQRQGPPVSFHTTYRFSKYNTYEFYIKKSRKQIYCAHTSVDLGMSTMGDTSCRHPNHSS